MDQAVFFAQLDEILELPPGTLKGPELLSDLENWDSLALMSFISLMSDQYQVTLSPRQISSCETVSDLWKLSQPKS